ncbi:MAG: PEP-CTERM sorting domain-containing protein [Pseudomonadota bacterium]
MHFKKTLLSLALASAAAVANAGIEVATFDELSVDLINNYYGASWTGNVSQSTDFAVSGISFLYGQDHQIAVTFASPITFIGAYYASWGGAGANGISGGGGHSFELFSGNDLVFQGPMDQPVSGGLEWVASSYTGTVTGVVFYGGSEGPAIDNFTFTPTTAVPEPESYAMLLAGLGLMGAIVRRRKSNKA